jgi:hypothetical protein
MFRLECHPALGGCVGAQRPGLRDTHFLDRFSQWERQAQVSATGGGRSPTASLPITRLEACGAPARIRRSVSPVRALRWRLVPIQIATTATTTSESTTSTIADLNVIAGDL